MLDNGALAWMTLATALAIAKRSRFSSSENLCWSGGVNLSPRAEILFEYRPARFGPMTVALLFILALATPIGAVDRAVAGRLDQALLALSPLAAILLFGFLTTPSTLRIEEDAIEVSRSRVSRMFGARTRFPLASITNIYPSFYEDAGMRFSPFASAEGTAKHAGLRIETDDGERIVVPFTPTVLNLRKHGTPPYHAAVEAVRAVCARAGRPMVTKPPAFTDDEVEEMLVVTARPLLPFPLTVAGIFAPGLLIPGLALAWGSVAGPLPSEAIAVVVLVGLSPLVAVFAFVNLKSGKRAQLLHEVQKYRQSQKESNPAQGETPGAPNRSTDGAPGRVLWRRAR